MFLAFLSSDHFTLFIQKGCMDPSRQLSCSTSAKFQGPCTEGDGITSSRVNKTHQKLPTKPNPPPHQTTLRSKLSKQPLLWGPCSAILLCLLREQSELSNLCETEQLQTQAQMSSTSAHTDWQRGLIHRVQAHFQEKSMWHCHAVAFETSGGKTEAN